MKIVDERKGANLVTIKDLKPGDVFQVDGHRAVYMSVAPTANANCANLESGSMGLVYGDTKLIRLEATIIVHGEK